jgi:hypothetical protein
LTILTGAVSSTEDWFFDKILPAEVIHLGRRRMMRIRVRRIGAGSHPSEVIVAVPTADGRTETLVIDERGVSDDTIEVGYPVGKDNDRLLVELPRETLSGAWRVWVPKAALIKEKAVA